VGIFAVSLNVEKSKMFQLQEALPLPFWPGALPLDSAGGCATRPPFIEASQLHLGAFNSLPPALIKRIYARALILQPFKALS